MYAPVPSGTGGRKTGKSGVSESGVLAERRRVLRTEWRTQGVRSAEYDRFEKARREFPQCMGPDRTGKVYTGDLPNLELPGDRTCFDFRGKRTMSPRFRRRTRRRRPSWWDGVCRSPVPRSTQTPGSSQSRGRLPGLSFEPTFLEL